MPRHWTVFFANVRFACNWLFVEHKGARIRKPQNLVKFCRTESFFATRLPDDVVDQRPELISVKLHGPQPRPHYTHHLRELRDGFEHFKRIGCNMGASLI